MCELSRRLKVEGRLAIKDLKFDEICTLQSLLEYDTLYRIDIEGKEYLLIRGDGEDDRVWRTRNINPNILWRIFIGND